MSVQEENGLKTSDRIDERAEVMEDKEMVTEAENNTTDDSVMKSEAKVLLEAQDPYFYLQRKEFTSEIFKISVDNLPRFGFNQLKKKLTSMEIIPRKMKALQNQRHAWITFSSETARDEALQKLDGYVWKNCTLKAKKANPSKDPLVQKRSQEGGDETDEPGKKKAKKDTDTSDGLTWEERLQNSVTPLHTKSYDEQLKIKQKEAEDVLDYLTIKLKQTFNTSEQREWLNEQKKKYGGKCFEVLPVKPSPILTHYRNKSEFTIGTGPDGEAMTIGFCFGLYKDGYNQVGNPECITIISDGMKKLLKSIENCLRESPFKAFDTSTHEGHWRTLILRETRNGDLMAILQMNDYTGLSKESVNEEKLRLRQYFTDGPGKNSGLVSFYLVHQQVISLACGQQREDVYEHIMGQEHITEDLMDLKFRISPDAFFQVNTLGCEVLYKQIGEWCNISEDTTLLDVCCGTGTIGLTLAKQVSKVIGIEMCKQAVDDAKKNAEINGVKNVEYICSKAEDAMKDVMRKCFSKNIVAVVDPPRAGLHNHVIHTLRNCRRLSRIVYVSCSPKSAVPNLLDLIKAPTKKVKGEPFHLVKAIPVDLFPQTKHYELILLFERNSLSAAATTIEKPTNSTVDSQVTDVQPTDVSETTTETDFNSSGANDATTAADTASTLDTT